MMKLLFIAFTLALFVVGTCSNSVRGGPKARCCEPPNPGRRTGMTNTPVPFPVESQATMCGNTGQASGVVSLFPYSDPTVWPTPNTTEGQAKRVLRDLELQIAAFGLNRASITWMQTTINRVRSNATEFLQVFDQFFAGISPRPTLSLYSVPSAFDPFSPYLLQGDASFANTKAIESFTKPGCSYNIEAFGRTDLPYSEALVAGNVFYTSTISGSGASVGEQMSSTLDRVKELLELASMDPRQIVFMNVYMNFLNFSEEVDQAYLEFLEENGIADSPPPRAMVAGTVLTSDPDALVFVDVVAVDDSQCSSQNKNKFYNVPFVARDPLSSHAVRTTNRIYTSAVPGLLNEDIQNPVFPGEEPIDIFQGLDNRTSADIVHPLPPFEMEAFQTLQNLEYITAAQGVLRYSFMWLFPRFLEIGAFYDTYNNVNALFYNGTTIAPPARTTATSLSIFPRASMINQAIACIESSFETNPVRVVATRDWAADAQSNNAFFGASFTQTWCTDTTNPGCMDGRDFRSGSLN